jgi:holo-[acyl-carrier protein] synthase
MADAGILTLMSIKGIGIDIIEIKRIEEAVNSLGDKFLRRIYTADEIDYCLRRKKMGFPELAARFAAKEAYAKSIGTGMRGIRWKDIETANNSKGKPIYKIKGKPAENCHLTLSHSRNYAVAMAVWEGNTCS